jgi:glyoxylase-like metal-dependent hydrolase (beta-lactamase superfamily II)
MADPKPIVRMLGSAWGISSLFLVEHREVLTVIDTGGPHTSVGRILKGIRRMGREPEDVRQLVLTHCHGDHTGRAKALQEATGATVIAGEADVPVIEGRAPYPFPKGPLGAGYRWFAGYERLPVDRVISAREEIEGGLVVVPAPGHTLGHIAVLAPDHGALFAADTVWHLGPVTESWRPFTQDPALNGESVRELATLGATRVLPSHGPDLSGDRLTKLASPR